MLPLTMSTPVNPSVQPLTLLSHQTYFIKI
jgi:hypothetical protein